VIGMMLGPYRILEKLGEGGMGVVYKARDTRLDRTVAIKVLPAELSADPDRRARFEREAKTIAGLSHPHICTLFDVGAHDGTTYLVMEHLVGETLAERVRRGPIPLAQALDLAAQIAEALDAAHKHGIVHRDLKPGNVMLAAGGAGRSGVTTAKLLDFGLAKLTGHGERPVLVGDASALTQTAPITERGTILGTLQYMAPEQLEGKEADARTDLWALGAILYEMVTGRRAFEGESQVSLIGNIMNTEPAALATLQPLTPPALERVVMKCLAKNPDDRWDTAHDVADELRWIASSLSAPAAAPAATRHSRRVSLLWWLPTTGLLIALAIALPAALRQWRATPPSPALVRFTIFPAENTTFPAAGGSVPFVQLAVSPDGRRVVFVASPPGGRPALWVRALDGMQPRMLGGTEDAAYPFWSPDSRFVGFFAQSKLKKIDIAGDVPHVLCDATIDSRGGTWNRDGVIVFVPSTSSGLFQVAAAGGVPAPLLNLRDGEFSYRWPSFLPDGRHFLFYVRAGTAQRGVYLGSLDDKTTSRVLDAPFSAVYSPPGYLLTVRDQALLAYPFDNTLMRVVGNPVRIAEHVGGSSSQMASFSVSANGVLGYAGGLTTLSRLEWYDRQGRALGTATDGGDYANFRLSPDARRVAVSQSDAQTNTGDLWLLEFSRNVVATRFTFDPANDTAPTWSPDGNRIVFRSDRAGGNFLFEKPAAGGEPERLLGAFDAPFPTDWSPDGKFILYHFPAASGNYDVNLVAPEKDAKPVPFASSPFTEIDGRFSPDGRWIAYSSDESGRMEVYVQPFPRSGSMWQVSTGGGSEAHWRRDGKELFYLAPDRKIMAVAVRGGSTFEREAPRPLFQTRVPFPGSIYRMNYDVTADGARFLVNTPVEGAGSSPINVVLDWPAGLKK